MIPKRMSCLLQSSVVPWLTFGILWEEHQGQSQMQLVGKASRRVEVEVKEKLMIIGWKWPKWKAE